MFEQIKKLSLQSLVYGVGHIMARLITFLLLPLYTNVFTTEEYGVVSLAYAFIGFALILFRYGTDTALMKFYIDSDGKNKNAYFSSIWSLQLLTSLVFSGALILSAPFLTPLLLGSTDPFILKMIAVIIALDVLWNIPVLILRAEERPSMFVGMNLSNVIATIVFNIYFVIFLGLGIDGVFYGNIVASSLMNIIAIPILWNRLKIKYCSKEVLKKVFNFSLPFVPAGLFTMIMELADRYLLEWLVGTSAVGIYSAGYKLGMFGLLMVMGFNMGWTPFFLKKGKEKDAKELFSRVTCYFLGMFGFVAIFLTLTMDDLVQLRIGNYSFFGEAFWSSTEIVPIILLAYFFFGFYVLQMPAVYMPELTKWVPVYRALGAAANVLFNIYFIPKYGVLGAAWSTMAAYAIMSITVYLISHKHYTIPFRWRGISFPIVAMIGAMALQGSALVEIVYLLSYVVLWFFIVADAKEKQALLNKLK